MRVQETGPGLISFQLVKPGTLFKDHRGRFWIKTDQSEALDVQTGNLIRDVPRKEEVTPYHNAIILPEGKTT